MIEKRPFDWTGNDAEDFFWVETSIIHTLALIILTAFTIYHYQKKQESREEDKTKTKSNRPKSSSLSNNLQTLHKINETMPYAVEILYIINLVFWILRETKMDYYFDLYTCKVSVQLGAVFWCFGKGALWLLFILRLHLAFHGSNRAYSVKKVIIPFSVYATCASIAGGVFGTAFSLGEFNKWGRCMWAFPLWCESLLACSDLFISCVCLILFVRPLRELSQKHDDSSQIRKLRVLIEKYTILVVLTIVTTVFGLVSLIWVDVTNGYWAAFSISIFALDCVTNGMCAILVSHIHAQLYSKLCFLCAICIFGKESNTRQNLLAASMQGDGNGENTESSRGTRHTNTTDGGTRDPDSTTNSNHHNTNNNNNKTRSYRAGSSTKSYTYQISKNNNNGNNNMPNGKTHIEMRASQSVTMTITQVNSNDILKDRKDNNGNNSNVSNRNNNMSIKKIHLASASPNGDGNVPSIEERTSDYDDDNDDGTIEVDLGIDDESQIPAHLTTVD